MHMRNVVADKLLISFFLLGFVRACVLGACGSQIFITKSPELLVRVRRFYDRMVRVAPGTPGALTTGSAAGDLEEAVRRAQAEEAEASGRLDVGDRDCALEDVPESFAEVEDRHFPLFLTFEKAKSMLERAYRNAARCTLAAEGEVEEPAEDREGWMEQGRTWATGAGGRRMGLLSVGDRSVWAQAAAETARTFATAADSSAACGEGRAVDFDRFMTVYWRNMDETLRSRLEPQLVWAEVQSLIKGSEDACRADTAGCLSLSDYESLSERRYPAFSHSRERLYRLFENYERLKRRRRDYDDMDRIHALFVLRDRLGPSGVLQPADELYVDEVQDLAPAMMRLLLGLLRRPGGFLMACGDTAQTIAKGSLFRFEDLSALVYRELVDTDHLGARLEEARLAHNYRSHNGILRLAASVVDLLYYYFPETVDRMDRDCSDEDGCLPIVWRKAAFLDCLGGAEQGWTTLFAGGGGSPGAAIEFGAEQAILVRGEATKKEIMKLEQRPGFVGTVFDAKGKFFRIAGSFPSLIIDHRGIGWITMRRILSLLAALFCVLTFSSFYIYMHAVPSYLVVKGAERSGVDNLNKRSDGILWDCVEIFQC